MNLMKKSLNGIKTLLGLNPPIKYILLIEIVFISNSKIKSCVVKVCFQSHVNMRKCYLPNGVLLKCFFRINLEIS